MYAVIGAATVYASVTKTVSIAVVIFECTGQMELLLPVLLGVGVSYMCTQGIAMCIFDVLLEFKNFPFTPTLGSEGSYSLTASDICQKNFLYLSDKGIFKDIPLLL
jgi:chloride channel 2